MINKRIFVPEKVEFSYKKAGGLTDLCPKHTKQEPGAQELSGERGEEGGLHTCFSHCFPGTSRIGITFESGIAQSLRQGPRSTEPEFHC